MMKGREAEARLSANLLLCLPSRPHCSPGGISESNKRRLRKSSTRVGGAQASPLLWAKAKSAASDTAEPTSPKVTCAGQIKVSQNTAACSNWQSMMDEIETIHDDPKQRKRSNWAHSLGFKTEIMQFLPCLRTLRFDLRCFGSFPAADDTTEDDDEDENEGYRENHVGVEETSDDASRAVFSKWFMMLQESQNNVFDGEDTRKEENVSDDGSIAESAVPPPHALLLMRCRSAPAKSRFKENDEVEQTNVQSMKLLMEKEEVKKENAVVMRYDSDFYKMSSDIAKESWMVGGLRDPLSKSRSCKR